MENNLIEVFGKIVKTSRDSGLDIVSNYKNNIEIPKSPDEEQKALMELIKTLDAEQFDQLQKGVKYCIELSLFKLISTIESGVSDYAFDLSIQNSSDKTQLVGENIDNELSLEYWHWIS
ncbi:hypothetical protein J3U22_02320 [Gilliamella sp. B2865]|uniref:hypothetical protein n=1 Tax=unclassified Gilliamella TaxID=2685620 RepID=UPI00226AD2F9|nr:MULTISPECIES: hypothetical protein [unclassified Gilliamella]MCX8669708.1 hypothetical protein [Gilliamella sp. B2785]MCX8678431.1 hypothetical protein [Gilliamella sp. B2865]